MKHHPARRIAPTLLAVVATLSCIPAASAANLTNLRCEYRDNPLGIDAEKPRLSWVIEERDQNAGRALANSEKPGEALTGMAEGNSEVRGQRQTAYQVLIASTPELLAEDQGDLWDSGKVVSDQSIQVEYAGKPLESRMICHWKVRVWLKDDKTDNRQPTTDNSPPGKPSAWSQPAGWSIGLLKPADWQAKWVKAGGDTSPWLRKEFNLTKSPERAMAFVNVKGYYELYVNGKKVSDDVLAPAVSVYKKRSLYNTYDIRKYLRPGTNCVGVWLGLGLVFRGDIAPLARVQLDMSVGGKREVVGTDNTWTWTSSTHTKNRWGWCGNGGEHIDMRRDIPDWSKAGCAGGKWSTVEEVANPSAVASAQSCPPNRIIKTIPAVSCTELRDTGMLGTYFLFQYLQQAGRNDLAFTMATQEDFPGWGYMLKNGATTMWEQWDGYWSQIHSCYTCPGGWMYQGLAGILPDETGPGFKKIIIKPGVVGDLTWVKCSYDSIHGKIVSNWKRESGNLKLDVTIPINTTATVYVPPKDADSVTESGLPTAKADGVKFLRMESGAAVYEVGSGSYRFGSRR
ncbi:MAG: alpha-L-rhamnosidase N-terminal domain-containing protein [Verrucomicrobia bacterium]|nr:alpha-L-rhamnosidase N-terminal domain-containing protein [Verrucomicrobiota bacterium]